MNDAPRTVPYYINEAKSDMRGIKSGWYAIDEDGNLVVSQAITPTSSANLLRGCESFSGHGGKIAYARRL